jgi:hypothetical protein
LPLHFQFQKSRFAISGLILPILIPVCPRTVEDRPNKSQSPSTEREPERQDVLVPPAFENWSFGFVWDLMLGSWNLPDTSRLA